MVDGAYIILGLVGVTHNFHTSFPNYFSVSNYVTVRSVEAEKKHINLGIYKKNQFHSTNSLGAIQKILDTFSDYFRPPYPCDIW